MSLFLFDPCIASYIYNAKQYDVCLFVCLYLRVPLNVEPIWFSLTGQLLRSLESLLFLQSKLNKNWGWDLSSSPHLKCPQRSLGAKPQVSNIVIIFYMFSFNFRLFRHNFFASTIHFCNLYQLLCSLVFSNFIIYFFIDKLTKERYLQTWQLGKFFLLFYDINFWKI